MTYIGKQEKSHINLMTVNTLIFVLRELQEVFGDDIEMFSEAPSDEWYFDSAKSELLAARELVVKLN